MGRGLIPSHFCLYPNRIELKQMPIQVLQPVDIAIKIYDYIKDNISKVANWVLGSPTSDLSNGSDEPYVPPFEGGQCETVYILKVSFVIVSTGERITPYDALTVMGKIDSIEPFNNEASSSGVRVYSNGGVSTVSGNSSFYRDYEVNDIRRADGLPDNCGNVPNPNPPSPTQDNPIPSGGEPVVQEPLLVDGGSSPPPLTPLEEVDDTLPEEATLPFIADTVKKVLDAIASAVGLVNELIDLLDKLKKKELGKKEIKIYPLGNVRKDGYISLASFLSNKVEPALINIVVFQVPKYRGKWFGEKSPHRYEAPLGYIMPVDSQFCIIGEPLPVKFVRQSVELPSLAIGFYYHFGLENRVQAQLSFVGLREV